MQWKCYCPPAAALTSWGDMKWPGSGVAMTSQLCSSQREWDEGPLLLASWGTEQAKLGMNGIWD